MSVDTGSKLFKLNSLRLTVIEVEEVVHERKLPVSPPHQLDFIGILDAPVVCVRAETFGPTFPAGNKASVLQ
jgi:hypothetical protein